MSSRAVPSDLPTGTVTFMFTDIEGSTLLLNRIGDEPFASLLDRHHEIIRMALDDGGGVEVSTEGDSFFAVFTDPLAAVVAAVDMQRGLEAKLSTESEPVLVRCGIHTGVGVLGGDNYSGMDVHKASRVSSAANGGQILLSDVTAQLIRERLPAGLGLVNVGRYRLEGFTQSDTLHQVSGPGLKNEFRPVRASRPKSRLPMPLTEFVGREDHLSAIETAVAGHRLVTLTGPGGTGKTRMAIELGHRLESSYEDGVAFVSLATVNDQSLIPSAILEVLELKTAGGVEPIDHLIRYLTDREMLLILDNLEQLTTGVQVLARLLEEAPALKMVATSRTPLRIAGEREMPVPPLDVPDVGSGQEKALQTAGVRLFANRAAAVRPGFEVDAANFETVAGIARTLDGLPLAIELAASRMRSLTPELIYERLGNQLLTSSASDLPARQQTIVNAIGWSYDLLSEPERLLFEQLSVFSGGFGLSEAEQVCRDHSDVLEGLVSLVEQSLLRQTETTGEPRFRMLTVIREFGYAALVARGDEQAVLTRHTDVYVGLAEKAGEEILTSKQEMWLRRLGADNDNLRAVFDRAVADGDHDVALRLSGALWRFWQIRGLLDEGQHRVETALALPGEHDREIRARALTALGGLLYWRGDWAELFAPYREALALYRDLGSDRGVAEALYNLSFPVSYSGDIAEAQELLAESLQLSEQTGWKLGEGRALWALGNVAVYIEDWKGSLELSSTAISKFEALDAPFDLGWAWFMTANAHARIGEAEPAREAVGRAVAIFAGVSDVSALALILEMLGYVLLIEGDSEGAAYYVGAARRLQLDTGVKIGEIDVNRFPEVGEFRVNMDEEEAEAFQRGLDSTVDEIVMASQNAFS
jgi:predicted ATPase/class 3 adenylate cyclase